MATINPFQGPINYSVEVQSPFEAALGGFKIGAAGAEIQAQQQKRELEIQAAQQTQQRQTELADLFKNPNATSADYERLVPFLPKEQAAIVIEGFGRKTKAQQDIDLRNGGQVYSAVKSGQLDIAMQILTDQAAALRNNGRENEAKAAEASAKAIELNPTGAQATVGLYMALLPGGTVFLEAADKALATIRAEAKAPLELAELEAKALEAGVTAEFARPLAVANLAKTKAETLSSSVREAIDFQNLSPGQQQIFQALQILKKPPAAVTNVNVSNVDKTASGELGKLVPDLYNQMNAASDLTGELARYRTALGTAITGPFADKKLQIAQVANAFGLVGDKGINATRELIQGNAEMSLKARSLISGQGQGPITEGEQALLVKARAGDINFTKGELNTLFNIFDRSAKAQYDQSRKLLQSATTQSPTAQLFLDAAKPFGSQTAPPVVPAAPAAVPSMPAGFRVIR